MHKHSFKLPMGFNAEKIKKLPKKRRCIICKQMVELDHIKDVDEEGYTRIGGGRMKAKKVKDKDEKETKDA